MFKKVNYPEDKKSIEHIIKEYDKVATALMKSGEKDEKLVYATLYSLNLIIVICLYNNNYLPIIAKIIYLIPTLLYTVYDAAIRITARARKNKDMESKFKLNLFLSLLILVWFTIFLSIIFYQSILFPKWTSTEYTIGLLILFTISLILSIVTRINMPKYFIKKFQYKKNEIFTMDKKILILMQVLISIIYIKKPYFILLSLGYMIIPILLSLILNTKFIINQYDKIEELKKEINYISKHK